MHTLFNGNIEELISVIKLIPISKDNMELVKEQSFDAMVSKMRNGCPILSQQYNAMPCLPVDILTPTYQLATEGLFIDVATFLNGEPECWLSENYNSDAKPAKDFYINISFTYDVSKETIFEKLVQIVQIIDSLEGNGQRLNVHLVYYTMSRTESNKAEFICKIKDQSEPVNIHQLIYLITSSVIQRYCLFTIRNNKWKGQGIYNYADMDSIMMQNQDIIYIPSYSYDRDNRLTNYKKTDLKTAYKII